MRPFALALGLLAAVPSEARASSLAREPILRVLRSTHDDVRRCSVAHYLWSGRHSIWIEVDSRGRARAKLRDSPGVLAVAARRCLERAFERPQYPVVGDVLVAWSSASPPGRSYSIAYPFELLAHDADWLGPSVGLRPRPERTQRIAPRATGR